MTHQKVQEAIQEAEHAICQLRDAKSSRAAKAAWISFLESSNRALNRLEGIAKKTDQKQKHNDIMKEVWATELTAYMRTARNVHEHGVEELQISEPYNERVVFPDGQVMGAPIVYAGTPDGRTIVIPAAGPTEFKISEGAKVVALKPGIRMLPVVSSKGETIMPPQVQILVEDEPEPLAAARLYLAWVREQVAKFD